MEERRARNCPACGKPLAGGGPAEPVFAESPRQGPARSESPSWDRVRPGAEQVLGWGTTRAGLGVLAVGVLVTLIAIVADIGLIKYREARVTYLIEHPGEQVQEPGLAYYFFRTLKNVALFPGGIALCAAGLFMSAAAPSESGAKLWTIGILLCLFLASAILLVMFFGYLKNDEARQQVRTRFDQPQEEKSEEPPWSKGLLTALRYSYESLFILGGIFFAGFQWGVARHFRRMGASVALLIYLILCSVAGITIFVLSCLAENTPSIDKIFIKEWVWIWLGVIAVFSVWTLVNLFVVRGIIGHAMVRRET
jgi:hypothetical protein